MVGKGITVTCDRTVTLSSVLRKRAANETSHHAAGVRRSRRVPRSFDRLWTHRNAPRQPADAIAVLRRRPSKLGLVLPDQQVISKKRDKVPPGTALSNRRIDMASGVSSVVAWQTVVPLVMGAMAILMSKWLSHVAARAASERTVRVVARLGPRGTSHRSLGRGSR